MVSSYFEVNRFERKYVKLLLLEASGGPASSRRPGQLGNDVNREWMPRSLMQTPLIPVVIGPVLTICLPVSILCPYMEITADIVLGPFYAHMPIYGDICLFASILCPYMEISVSVCLCPFMPVYGDICLSASILCPYMRSLSLFVCFFFKQNTQPA